MGYFWSNIVWFSEDGDPLPDSEGFFPTNTNAFAYYFGDDDAANNNKLTPAQCKAAQTLLAREAKYGTSIAAFTSAIGFGDNTVQPFNSSNTAPINTPAGQIKIDWYADIQATGPSFSFGVGNSIAYAEGKLIWTGLRLLTGAPITNYLPFTDAAERNTLQQTFSPLVTIPIFSRLPSCSRIAVPMKQTNPSLFRGFGYVAIGFAAVLALLFLLNLGSRIFLQGPNYSALGWMSVYSAAIGIGLVYLKKWAVALFAVSMLGIGIFVVVRSIIETPFPWMLLNIAIGAAFCVPSIPALRGWRELK